MCFSSNLLLLEYRDFFKKKMQNKIPTKCLLSIFTACGYKKSQKCCLQRKNLVCVVGLKQYLHKHELAVMFYRSTLRLSLQTASRKLFNSLLFQSLLRPLCPGRVLQHSDQLSIDFIHVHGRFLILSAQAQGGF